MSIKSALLSDPSIATFQAVRKRDIKYLAGPIKNPYKDTKDYLESLKPKIPEMPEDTTVVTDPNAAIKAAAKSEAERLKKRQGGLTTILTSTSGLGAAAPVQKKTLG